MRDDDHPGPRLTVLVGILLFGSLAGCAPETVRSGGDGRLIAGDGGSRAPEQGAVKDGGAPRDGAPGDLAVVALDFEIFRPESGLADGKPPADAAPTPTPDLTPAPDLLQPDTAPPCPYPLGLANGASFVDETVPDGTPFQPGQTFLKSWRLKNTGASTWHASCGHRFRHQAKELLGAPAALAPAAPVPPGATVDWVVPMTAPLAPGLFSSEWRMAEGAVPFGDMVWTTIKVLACANDSGCPNPAFSLCAQGSCIAPECTVHADCIAAGRPVCDGGRCVQCLTAAHCAPFGASSTCVAKSCTCGDAPWPAKLAWPAPKTLAYCQKFKNPITYQPCGWHTGIDICGTDGEPLLAVAPGKVVHVGPLWLDAPGTGRGPYSVVIQHGPKLYSTYGHNASALVKKGECVVMGQPIGTMGNLGFSKVPHLHLELLEGTPFTGNWEFPFSNACAYYIDPLAFPYLLFLP